MKFKTIDEYIKSADIEMQDKLNEIRDLIRKNAPEAEERMSWSMPTFWQAGNVCHFALHKNHIGFYPGSSGVENFIDELSLYKTSKGAIQFPLNKPLPGKLIERIVKFRVSENIDGTDSKKKN